MKLGIPLYERVNLLDVAGPLEMFHWAGEETGKLESVLVAQDKTTPVTSIEGVKFFANESFAEAAALDILWVPGGDPDALVVMMRNPDHPYFQYLRQIAARTTWVCSVCEGALLLGRAGLLDGHKATTHWHEINCLRKFKGITEVETNKRYVVSQNASGNRLTGGGISSGLDEALKLIMLLFDEDIAKKVQRTTQYFPEPPVMGEFPTSPPCDLKWE